MSMGSRSLPKPTEAEWERMGRCKEFCIVTWLRLSIIEPAEYNHALVAGHRMGHRFGYGLAPHYHQFYGKGRKQFQAMFGDDQFLQDQQDDALGIPRVTIPKGRKEARAMGTMAPAKARKRPKRGPQTQRSTKTLPRRGL